MIRVFPRRTKATPNDEKAFYTGPPLWEMKEENVYVSCAFTWDMPEAERLAREWEQAGFNVKIGGPAYDDRGGEFIPGRFLKPGYVITSRGCNNKCWFCSTWRREGNIRELPIREGRDVLDSNLLQCSEQHIRSVFSMLKRQPHKVKFSGGMEAALLKDWHVELLVNLKPRIERIYFAYDTPDDYEPLVLASKKLIVAGLLNKSRKISAYVLFGYPGDTQEEAHARLESVVKLNLVPYAMLYRDDEGRQDPEWLKFRRPWVKPEIVFGKLRAERHAKDRD